MTSSPGLIGNRPNNIGTSIENLRSSIKLKVETWFPDSPTLTAKTASTPCRETNYENQDTNFNDFNANKKEKSNKV